MGGKSEVTKLTKICALCGESFNTMTSDSVWCAGCRKCEECGSEFLIACVDEGLQRCLACLHLRTYRRDDGA